MSDSRQRVFTCYRISHPIIQLHDFVSDIQNNLAFDQIEMKNMSTVYLYDNFHTVLIDISRINGICCGHVVKIRNSQIANVITRSTDGRNASLEKYLFPDINGRPRNPVYSNLYFSCFNGYIAVQHDNFTSMKQFSIYMDYLYKTLHSIDTKDRIVFFSKAITKSDRNKLENVRSIEIKAPINSLIGESRKDNWINIFDFEQFDEESLRGLDCSIILKPYRKNRKDNVATVDKIAHLNIELETNIELVYHTKNGPVHDDKLNLQRVQSVSFDNNIPVTQDILYKMSTWLEELITDRRL